MADSTLNTTSTSSTATTASWTTMKANDSISGKEGELYIVIDSNKLAVAECKSITATITKNKVDVKVLGYRGTQHKATGWDGSGSLVVHYVSSRWASIMADYANNGKDVYYTLTITNNDPSSSAGTQTITLGDVNFDDCEIAKIDVDSDVLDQTLNFTFSTVSVDTKFNEISN